MGRAVVSGSLVAVAFSFQWAIVHKCPLSVTAQILGELR